MARWNVEHYPGRWRALGEIVGVKPRTAKEYISGKRRLIRKRRERLLAYLEADLQERLEVIRLLRLPDPEDERITERYRQGMAKALKAQKLKRVKAQQERRQAEIRDRDLGQDSGL